MVGAVVLKLECASHSLEGLLKCTLLPTLQAPVYPPPPPPSFWFPRSGVGEGGRAEILRFEHVPFLGDADAAGLGPQFENQWFRATLSMEIKYKPHTELYTV